MARQWPVGAELIEKGGVDFRVWAPGHSAVKVVGEGPERESFQLDAVDNGYFRGEIAQWSAGQRYRYRLSGGELLFPDPASRYQPTGPHGPSEVVDPKAFAWTDADWKGCPLHGQVLYEMHLGTFTPEGTWAAAMAELPELAEIGITCLEIMPVAEFPGRFGWGYDGANLFAPTRLYGTPDDMRAFVDRAHSLGVGVILDVVYNHLGPDGNYLGQFSQDYFTDKHKTDWGRAIHFDGPNSAAVREFYISNAAYWIAEFHLDGLRLDATQNIYDDAPPGKHILADIGRAARDAAPHKSILIVNENESQHSELVRPLDRGGYGLDALWNDDFHHSAVVALTGRTEAYYADYRGDPQEFIATAKYGYLYQGQWYSWQEKSRGTPALDIPPAAFINFIENHDQVANSARGLRVNQLTSSAKYRAMTALLLLSPGTPMLFQGQEFASRSPFHYFADHGPELAAMVKIGRVEFLAQFRSLVDAEMEDVFGVPHELATFERCKLDFRDRVTNAPHYRLVKDLLKLRRTDSVFRAQKWRGVDGAVLGPDAFALRYFTDDGSDRLLLVNFGRDLKLHRVADPLLAPPAGRIWETAFSTESASYGGMGVAPLKAAREGWRIGAESARVLIPGDVRIPFDPESI